MPEWDSVAIVGMGLIGGSIGLALRDGKMAREVVGIGRRDSSLDGARQVDAIDRGTTDLAEGVASAQLVIVCTPVDTVPDMVQQVAAACPSEAIITDAGSTKRAIVEQVDTMLSGDGPRFVGSHPMAGDHQSGAYHAQADLFEGRKVVVTPTDATDKPAVDRVLQFWQSLGAKTVTMTPDEHDAAVAAISHLPHLVAAALASATPEKQGSLAASGWRDTTRVASGEAALWRPIFATNRTHVVEALDRFDATLAALRQALVDGDDAQLEQLLQQAKRIRDALGN